MVNVANLASVKFIGRAFPETSANGRRCALCMPSWQEPVAVSSRRRCTTCDEELKRQASRNRVPPPETSGMPRGPTG
ncbi:hypothetical protein IF1G_02168 [Cordyceps javanica]|uniref:Uncharacterized protein n=1 Tax=Cordyceps javanica TaxID=43265 RepID=A0A545VE00_9HYPO|nr:hypothetical protein IF1G_02168 [Cordyceps javanica]